MRQPVDAKIDVRESYCRINKICWNFPAPPGRGGGGWGGTKHKHKQTIYSAAFHTNFQGVKEIFFFFLGFTQNIKITKIQLSGEEEKKKKKKTVRYSLGEFEIMRVTITYDSSI